MIRGGPLGGGGGGGGQKIKIAQGKQRKKFVHQEV